MGAEIFSNLMNINHKKLQKVLRSHHIDPKKMHERTILVHPSPISMSTLDMCHNRSNMLRSPHIMSFFDHMEMLVESMATMYLIEMLSFAKQTCDPRDKCQILKSLDRVLVNVVTDKLKYLFRLSLIYQFALGVVPLKRKPTSFSNPPQFSDDDDMLTRVLSYYTVLYDDMISSITIPSVVDFASQFILTYRHGKYTCTTYDGDKYDLVSYDDLKHVELFANSSIRTPLMHLVPIEYQYVHLKQTCDINTMKKSVSTTLIVSSVLNPFYAKILETYSKPTTDKTKESEIINNIDVIADLSSDISSILADGREGSIESQFNIIMREIETIKNKGKASEKLESLLCVDSGEKIEDILKEIETEQLESFLPSFASYHDNHSTQIGQREAQLNSTVQALQRMHTIVQRHLPAIVNETKRLSRDVYTLNLLNHLYVKRHDQDSNVVKEMKGRVDKTAKTLTENDKIIRRLTDQNKELEKALEIYKNVTNEKRAENDHSEIERANECKSAFSHLLDSVSIEVLGMFNNVRDEETLSVCNNWLPYTWMHDNWRAKKHYAIKHDESLHYIDINPPIADNSEHIKNIVKSCTGHSFALPVYQRNFLNVQPPNISAGKKECEQTLKEMWTNLQNVSFRLSKERYTQTGQKVERRIFTPALNKYIKSFLDEFTVQGNNREILITLVDDIIEERDISTGVTQHTYIESIIQKIFFRQQ